MRSTAQTAITAVLLTTPAWGTALAGPVLAGLVLTGPVEIASRRAGVVCLAIYQPVCAAVDRRRRTFGNACEAKAFSATAVRPGPCLERANDEAGRRR